MTHPPIAERFWSRVDAGGPDECWLWTGELNNKGYGVFYTYANGGRQKHYAHRMAMRLAGTLIDGMNALHSCDTPRCVNPSHLRPGTQLENIHDAMDRGRMNTSGLALGGRRPIRLHGTMSCYVRGCREEAQCPGDENGVTCRAAYLEYYRERRERARKAGAA